MTFGALGKGSPRKAKSPVKTTRFKLDPAYDQAEENELQDEEVQSTEDRTDASEPDKTSKTPKRSKTPKTPNSGKKESKTPKKTPRRKDKDT